MYMSESMRETSVDFFEQIELNLGPSMARTYLSIACGLF